jgi:hypothetical protein
VYPACLVQLPWLAARTWSSTSWVNEIVEHTPPWVGAVGRREDRPLSEMMCFSYFNGEAPLSSRCSGLDIQSVESMNAESYSNNVPL